MPTKERLDTLRDERKKLAKKKNLSLSDERRLRNLDRLIREGERTNQGRVGAMAAGRAKARFSPWETKTRAVATATRIADAGGWGTAAGSKAKSDQLRIQFGLDPIGQAFSVGVEDAAGNVTYQLDPALEGFRFGPNNGRMSGGQRAGSNVRGRDLSMMTGMSVKDVQTFYQSLSDEELIKFQHQLVEAGLLEKPTLGIRDVKTGEALVTLMKLWMSEPDMGVMDLLARLRMANASTMDEETRKILGDGMSGTGVVSDEVANITITDAATLDDLVDQVSQDLFGSFIDPERKAALIGTIQERERSRKTTDVQRDFGQNVERAKKEAAASNSAGSELERFMEALIQQESGGDPNAVNPYSGARGLGQFMYWDEWAREAGKNPADFSAGNQREVMRYKLAQYYQSYGNWRDVALAWYGGAGGVARVHAGGGNSEEADGHPSLNSYADQLVASMGAITQFHLSAGAQEPNLTVNVQEEMTDPRTQIEQELKRADPARYAGTQFARQAENFFALLNGVN